MATVLVGSDGGGETALPAPVSGVLGTILSLGGLLLVTGTIGLSVVQLRIYEDRIAYLERTLAGTDVATSMTTVDVSSPDEASVEERPSATSSAQPADDRVPEFEAQVAQLGDELNGARAELTDARKTIDGLRGELESCRGQLANPNSRLRELNEENARLRAENRRLQQTCAPAGQGEVFR